MAFKLVCINPFGEYKRAQEITDPKEVESLNDREGHFVRVYIPDAVEEVKPVQKIKD